MKVKLDDNEIFSYSEMQKKVILNYSSWHDFEEESKRRIQFVFNDIYGQSLAQLRAEWEPKLIARGHEMLPVSLENFAKLVFAQSDYKSRDQREEEDRQARRVLEESTAKVL